MTTSDKITHVVDVIFLVGIITLVYLFSTADRQHEKELSAMSATIQELDRRVVALEAKVGKPDAPKPAQ